MVVHQRTATEVPARADMPNAVVATRVEELIVVVGVSAISRNSQVLDEEEFGFDSPCGCAQVTAAANLAAQAGDNVSPVDAAGDGELRYEIPRQGSAKIVSMTAEARAAAAEPATLGHPGDIAEIPFGERTAIGQMADLVKVGITDV